MSQQNTLYAILGIEPSSSPEEIEAAYMARLKEAQETLMQTHLYHLYLQRVIMLY